MSYSLRYAYILCFPFSWFHLLENSQLDMMDSLFFIRFFSLHLVIIFGKHSNQKLQSKQPFVSGMVRFD